MQGGHGQWSQRHCQKYAIVDSEGNAMLAAKKWECFWQRGLIPKAWLKAEDQEDTTAMTWANGEFSKSVWNVQDQVVYVDESAGQHSSIPQLRQCGWGLFMMDANRQPR